MAYMYYCRFSKYLAYTWLKIYYQNNLPFHPFKLFIKVDKKYAHSP